MQFTSMILSNVEISPGYWRIRLTAPQEFGAAKPGQFVMVRIGGGIDPLLRRPFAIFDIGTHVPAQSGAVPQVCFEMLYKVVGKGTALLASHHAGEIIDVLGPLGTGFDQGSDDEEKLIVGGGIGLAPLYPLCKELTQKKSPVRLFVGGRTQADILCLEDFKALGVDCHVATEDGSLGTKGFVTKALEQHLDQLSGKAALYVCGPHGMLAAVARIADARQLPCQVSLENYMACGVGACLGCVTPGKNHSPTTPDYRCVCAEGPVFASNELQWRS